MLGWVAEPSLLGWPEPEFLPKKLPWKTQQSKHWKKGQDTSQAKETTDSALQNAALGALSARRCNYLSTEGEWLHDQKSELHMLKSLL